MSYPVMPLGFLGSQGDNDTYRIERSLRFNSADSAYLSRTYGSGTSATTWTISCWVKRSSFGAATCIFSERLSSNANVVTQLDFQSSDTLRLVGTNTSGSVTLDLTTTQVFRDPSAWFHLVVAADSTQATASERFKIYINGSQVTSLGTATYPAQNSTFGVFSASEHNIGRRFLAVSGTDALFNGYITEFHAIDGQALTPSSFGETDAITGRWKAKAYGGTYGTNGFYLKFADNSGTTSTTLGKDSSGNGNNWTPNNFSVTAGAGNDSLLDSPTNNGTSGNYATLNVVDRNSSISLVGNGNLEFTQNSNPSTGIRRGTIGITSGKWYYEATPANVTAFSTQHTIGIIGDDHSLANYVGSGANGYAYRPDGNKLNNSTATSYGTTTTSNTDVIMVAFDADNWKIWFGKNGTWFASGDPVAGTNAAFSSITGGLYYFAVGSQHTGFGAATWVTNFGQRPFAYTAPSGYKALCTTNLPQPTIQKSSKYMDVVTYTGTGATQTISGLGFSPDFLWTKGRSLAQSHNIFDTQRSGQRLRSDTTGAEASTTVTLGSNGFTLGTETESNNSGSTFVAWAWDEAPIAGMDIVSFTAPSGTSQSTVAHNLGVAPKMIIVKNRDTNANNWAVFHSSVCDTTSKFLQLNTTAALQTFSTVWGASLPTSSVFGVTGGGVAASGVNCIAYLFAEVEGFSKFGSYTGNGSADGPFVWCGFRPRWVLGKRTDSTGDWWLLDTARDTFNVSQNGIVANSSAAESTGWFNDILSSGFKLRVAGTGTSMNASGSTYIFAAFAESPFKYARAR